MAVFGQNGTAVEWRGGHEAVRIEPWGPDSLRVCGTRWAPLDRIPVYVRDGGSLAPFGDISELADGTGPGA